MRADPILRSTGNSRMTSQYDIIIIGAGHNGLVAAAYLARAGKKVLLLERRAVPGGQLVSETVAKDFTIDAIHAGARLRPDIARELGLSLPCLLYTSDAADERSSVDLGGRRIIKKKKSSKP